MKIVSWNVNGIAACRRRGFLKFLADSKADVVCCQEVRSKVPLATPGYMQFWNPAKKPGYSGTLILAKKEPLHVTRGFGIEKFDDEGRFILAEYDGFFLANLYAPGTWASHDRLDYRVEWDAALREFVSKLNKPAILCGDFNTAREPIDTYPENVRNKPDLPNFTEEERYGMSQLLDTGFVDAFRTFYPEKECAYTWWSPKNNCRVENRGSRLDYFLVSQQLISSVRSVRHHTNTDGSDHCPISILLTPYVRRQDTLSVQNRAAMWQGIDWQRMEDQLYQMQKILSQAAYYREWEKVERLQAQIVASWAARVLAVRAVAARNTSPGVDGVTLDTDDKKMELAQTLTPRGYHPMPYKHKEVVLGEKTRVLHIPTARDKAMQVLYAYTLDPVEEAIADKKSFSARKGRSGLDLHAYLQRDLESEDPPDHAAIADVEGYYGSLIHTMLLKTVPMDKSILKKFLKAGIIRDGEFFATNQGISLGTSLSPILGNIMLDGLQTYIYDRLYPKGSVDYLNGNVYRYADDILVTARGREQAERIMQIIADFLGERGLRLNRRKSCVASVSEGFDFLSRHYERKNGVLTVSPANGSIKKCERELKALILDFKGPLRKLIEAINDKLTGWASYHRVTDAYMDFRHIDAVVTGLLVERMCRRRPRWHRETILKKYFMTDGRAHIFILPEDPSVRVIQLAPLSIVRHKPCKLSFNPYLDREYHQWLQGRHDIQKASGKFKAVWNRQGGRCACCGQEMLPNQEVEVIEKRVGQGWRVQNLAYIHRQCAYDIYEDSDEWRGEPLDLFALLAGIMDDAPEDESPYWELTEYFRLTERTPIVLTFQEIEKILGEPLNWEAHRFKAFWYDDIPGHNSPMWTEERYPFHAVQEEPRDYCIANSWLSQGYRIKSLDLLHERVVFRREVQGKSGLVIPRQLTRQKIPDEAAREARRFFSYLIKKYGL